MPDNVTQVEGLDFTVQDHATAPADRMAKSFEHVHHAAEGVTRKLGEMTHHAAMSGLAMVGLGFGFREVAKFAGDANLELEHAAKKIAGVQFTFSNWKAGTTAQEKWNESLEGGNRITEKLRSSESKLKMTRGDLAEIYKSQAMMSSRYGQSETQQLDLTEKLAATQKVLGISAEGAGDMIARAAMTGAIPMRTTLGRELAAGIGNLKKFKHESEAIRFERLKKALGDMVPAAVGMGKGIEGSIFDAKTAINELTRDLTGPVFAEVTKDFSDWAHELGKVREGGQSAAAEWGGKLVTAFGYLKDATAFIAEHWKTIAGIFIATKFTGAMQGLAGRFGASAEGGGTAGGVAGMAAGTMNVSAATVNVHGAAAGALGATTAANINARLKPTLAETATKFTGMLAKVGMISEALGGLYVGLDALAQWALHRQDKDIEAKGISTRTQSAISAYTNARRDLMGYSGLKGQDAATKAFSHVDTMLEAYGMKQGQRFSQKTIFADLKAMGPELAEQVMTKAGGGTKFHNVAPEEMALRLTTDLNAFLDRLEQAYPGLAKGKDSKVLAGKDVTNISIAHLEITQDFKQADPDRVFHNVPRDIVDLVNSPRASGIAAVAG